jgi:1-acyl-sn-glycerol-3-phosphate acyltransferase
MPNHGPACARAPLVDAIATFLAHQHAAQMSEIRALLERTIDEAGPYALVVLGERLAGAGADWRYYSRDPLARGIHNALAGPVLRHEPVVRGAEHLALVADKPVVIVANHLSYSDANVIDVLLQKVDGGRVADRLTVIAGPKVYSNVRRRFSSLCFGTIKVPQTSTRASAEAVMTPRAVARAARQSIAVAQERLRLGEALLIFAEGTRSRTGQLQRFLSAAARYLTGPETWVVPMGLAGTERLFPIDGNVLNPVRITLAIGRPVRAAVLHGAARGDRQLVMDCIGIAIAELLSADYRGVYGEASTANERARVLRREW